MTLAVAIGLVVVFVFWVVVVGVLLIDFAPGTNDVSVATEASGGPADAEVLQADPEPTPGSAATTTGASGENETTVTAAEAEATPSEAAEEATLPTSTENEPASIAHRIAPGETLTAIGARYGVDWREIASINNIPDPDLIAAGRILQIPDADAVALVTISSIDAVTVADLDPVFDSWAAQAEVPVELLKAVAWQESRWDVGAVGLQGEIGIGQLLPEIHAFVESDLAERPLDPADPADSVEAMARYLGWLLSETQGDTSATLASYHQGLVSQRNIGWNDDTVRYIASVVAFRPEFVDRPAG